MTPPAVRDRSYIAPTDTSIFGNIALSPPSLYLAPISLSSPETYAISPVVRSIFQGSIYPARARPHAIGNNNGGRRGETLEASGTSTWKQSRVI